jgi:hypothetical protein
MRNDFCCAAAAVLMGLAPSSAWLVAQEQEPADAKSLAQRWLDERHAEFQGYRLVRAGQAAALTMEPRSILNWSNPERGTDRGAVFLWSNDGRPQLIACGFEWGGSLKHEFQSLSTDAIIAERDGGTVHHFGPGVEWKSLSNAPDPASQRALRLSQMRRLAERFRVSVGNKEWSETRLLTQPAYRSPMSAPNDIALFLFVQGTDPECVLLLEATPQGNWQYALARQTKWGLKVELDNVQVWERSPFAKPDPQSPFVVFVQK